ncbi:hypothetical protein [Moorena sp. SIO3B2]|nr:hypothetical protein [Moorena sp. SIO3B2]
MPTPLLFIQSLSNAENLVLVMRSRFRDAIASVWVMRSLLYG